MKRNVSNSSVWATSWRHNSKSGVLRNIEYTLLLLYNTKKSQYNEFQNYNIYQNNFPRIKSFKHFQAISFKAIIDKIYNPTELQNIN